MDRLLPGAAPCVPGGIHGADRVTNLYWAQHLRLGQQLEYRMAIINGEPGFLRYASNPASTTTHSPPLPPDMHWADLLKQGVDARHVNAVAGWREAHRFFSDRERAALNWAEAVNAVPHRAPSDADFEEIRRHFSDAETADLTFAVGAIRSWNMLNASFHTPVPEVPYVAE